MIPIKRHLSGLPNLREDQVPQRTTKASKKGLVLLPLYRGTSQNDVAHHAAICAVWARRTWMLYSDANDLGIEVKFYVENKVRDDAMPVFEKNFVDEKRDIIYFEGEKLEGILQQRNGDYSTFGAKKFASYSDYRFQDYDWTFDVDSDIFVWSQNGQKLPFFKRFFATTPDNMIGAWWLRDVYDPVPLNWCRGPYGNSTEASIADWKERFEAFAGREMLHKYCSPHRSFINCHSGITSFPAKHFMTRRRADCEWLISAARMLACSEGALSLWHSKGNPIFDMEDVCSHVVHHNRFSPDELRNFWERVEDKPFLFHYANPGIDYAWRKAIGILGEND